MALTDGDARGSGANRNLTIAGIALVAVTIAIACLTMWNLRRDAVARAMQDTNKLGILLADQNARLIQAADLVLKETREMITAASVRTPDQFDSLMATEKVHDYLVDRLRGVPQAEAISLIDSAGKVVNYSRSWPPAPIDTGRREFYQTLRNENKTGVFVGLPFRNATNGTWDIPIERRVNGPQGEFLGLINMMVKAQYFEDLFRKLAASEGESIGLFRRDGTLLVRYPHIEGMMGQKLPSDAAWYKIAGSSGTYRTVGVLDGLPRIISAHPLENMPLVVFATVSEQVELADWRHQSLLIASGALLSTIGLVIFLWIIRVQFQKREQTANALRDSETRFRDFAVTSSDWFWETDENHRFTYLSDNIGNFGAGPGEYLGKTRFETSADADANPFKWQDHLAMLARHEPFHDFIYARKVRAGPFNTASVSGVPLFDAAGNFLGYRGTARDITVQVRAEHDLRTAKEAAEAASRAKTQFLANISHELRTPLNAIIGFTEMVEYGLAGPIQPKQQEFNGLVLQSARHLLRIINDILDLSRADAGKFQLSEERGIDIGGIIEACVALMRPRADAGGLRLSRVIDDGLPLAIVDPTRIKQVMLNLLSNAVSFTKPGGSVVIVGRHRDDGGIAFEVRDTGTGMTPEEIEIALEPFSQVDARMTREHEGTGLGLPLARRLVELHGGSLHVDSQKGRGTTVTVVLPASRVLVDQGEPVVAARTSSLADGDS